jgi:hypothetical protein
MCISTRLRKKGGEEGEEGGETVAAVKAGLDV